MFEAIWRNKYKLKEADIRSVMTQILSALQSLHSCGIMHRDVTLSNIVLSNKGKLQVKLVDFGLAIDRQNDWDRVVSTHYTAPEIILADMHGPEVDVFMAGIVAFMLLTGEKPIRDDLKITRHCEFDNEQANLLDFQRENLCEAISDEALQFLRSALYLNPNQRPSVSKLLKQTWLCNDA